VDLHKSYTNVIIETIRASNLTLGEFVGNETDDSISLRHTPSGAELTIRRGPLTLDLIYTVGDTPPYRADSANGPNMAERFRRGTERWLAEIEREFGIPDLWSDFMRETRMSALLKGQENTRFAPQEQREIAQALLAIKIQAADFYELSAGQLAALEAKCDYLSEAAGRVGRVDWLNIAVGAMAGRFADVLLAPDVVHKVLDSLGIALGPLFGHPMPLLPGP
jgi:hypothetical protein